MRTEIQKLYDQNRLWTICYWNDPDGDKPIFEGTKAAAERFIKSQPDGKHSIKHGSWVLSKILWDVRLENDEN